MFFENIVPERQKQLEIDGKGRIVALQCLKTVS